MKKLLIAILLMLTAPFAFAYDETYVQIMVKPSECKRVGDVTASVPLSVLKGEKMTDVVADLDKVAKEERWSPDLVTLSKGLINMWYSKSLAEMVFGKYQKDETEYMTSMMGDKAERTCVKSKGIMYIDNRMVGRK